MFVSIDDAEKDLADLVSKVEAGGEVILTRQGCAVVRLITVDVAVSDRWKRRAVIEAARALAADAVAVGDEAAHTQDFLYADDGLPR